MRPKDISTGRVSDWQPITDRFLLALLGKLAEEVNELGGIISRCIIQGLDECHPETGKVNRQALLEEIADVYALGEINITELDLNRNAIVERRSRKMRYKQPWFDSLRDQR